MSAQRIHLWALLFIALALLVAGCGSGDNSSGETATSVSISTAFPSAQPAGAQALNIGFQPMVGNAFTDVTGVSVNVTRVSDTNDYGDTALTPSGSTFSGSISGLPVGTQLLFYAVATNSGASEIFTGSTTATLTGVGDTVQIEMGAAAVTFDIPQIVELRVPAEILINTAPTIDADIQASATFNNLDWLFSAATGGSFAATLPATEGPISSPYIATVSDTYTAGATPGTYTSNQLEISNASGATVTSVFPLTLVDGQTSTVITTLWNPSLISIDLLRVAGDNNLQVTAHVSDNVNTSGTGYAFSYSGVPSFDGTATGTVTPDATVTDGTATSTLVGYTGAESGTITLALTDADGGVTSTDIPLPLNLFPDGWYVPLFDFETGTVQTFVPGGSWHVTDVQAAGGSTYSMSAGDTVSPFNVPTGQGVIDLTSPVLSTGSTAFLRYNVRFDNGCVAAPCTGSADRLFVQVSTDGTAFTTLTGTDGEVIGTGAAFAAATPVDLAAAGYPNEPQLWIRFSYDANSTSGSFEGPFVDDIRITVR